MVAILVCLHPSSLWYRLIIYHKSIEVRPLLDLNLKVVVSLVGLHDQRFPVVPVSSHLNFCFGTWNHLVVCDNYLCFGNFIHVLLTSFVLLVSWSSLGNIDMLWVVLVESLVCANRRAQEAEENHCRELLVLHMLLDISPVIVG